MKLISLSEFETNSKQRIDPKQMNVAAAVWAVVSYVIADMEEMLPRS